MTTEYAKDVEGVKEVNNEMTVTKTSKKKRTVGEKIDDASITAKVKMTLLYHRSTSAINTKVETKLRNNRDTSHYQNKITAPHPIIENIKSQAHFKE